MYIPPIAFLITNRATPFWEWEFILDITRAMTSVTRTHNRRYDLSCYSHNI